MTTYYINPTGNDSRSNAQAQVSTTPWRTPMKALSVMGTDDICILQDGTWDGSDAVIDSRGWPTNLSGTQNYHPTRGVFRVLSGSNPIFKIPYGTGADKGVQGVSGHSGHLWMFVNPDEFLIDIQDGATLTLQDYEDASHTYPRSTYDWANGNADVPSAIYFGYRSGRSGPSTFHNPTVRGRLIVNGFQGNGVRADAIAGLSIEPAAGWDGTIGVSNSKTAEVTDCATGVRFMGTATNGIRFQTTLAAAAAIGATTITVSSVGSGTKGISTAFGNCRVVINNGLGNLEWRKVTAINGNVLTLGAGPYATLPLRKAHALGAIVRVISGAVGVVSHDNHRRGKSVSGAEFGSEGYSVASDAYAVCIAQCESYENWGVDTVAGYVDGGGIETYGMRSDSAAWFTENLIHDNQGNMETGTDLSGHPTWGNGNWRWDWSLMYGKGDQNDHYPGNPKAPLMLTRASQYGEVEHNSVRLTAGNLGDGGFRYTAGGGFGGNFDHTVVRNNAIQIAYGGTSTATPIYNMQGGAIATGTIWRNNYIYYSVGYTGNVLSATTSYTVAQRATAASATGQFTGDTWTNSVAPGWVDGANNNFALNQGSPLIGAADDGRNIGAGVVEGTTVNAGAAAGTGAVSTARGKVATPPDATATGTGTANPGAGQTTSGSTSAAPTAATGVGSAGSPKASVATSAPLISGTAGVFLPVATDNFSRVGSDLGVSSSGFSYATVNVGASGGGFTTDGSVATDTLAAPTQQNDVELLNTSARDVRAVMRFKTDKPPVSDLIECWLWVRRAGMNSTAYGSHFLIFPTDTRINFNRRDSAGVRTAIPTPIVLADVWTADTYWVMIFECFGVSPTTLRMKVYPEASGEPADWQLVQTDSSGPQVTGAVGFAFRMDTGTTNAPIVFTFDDLAFTETVINSPSPKPLVGTQVVGAAAGTGAANNATTTGTPTIPSPNPHLTLIMGAP